MKVAKVISFCVLLIFCSNTWSRMNCKNVTADTEPSFPFSEIDLNCISTAKRKYSQKPLALSKIKKNTIIFYQTPLGEKGKLRVLSVINNTKKECTLSIEALTYSGESSFVPKSSLSIGPQKNYWLADKVFLNKTGDAFFSLQKLSGKDLKELPSKTTKSSPSSSVKDGETRTKASCYLIPSEGTQYSRFYIGSNEEKGFKQDSPSLLYAPLVLIFVAIFLIVRVFIEDQDKYKAQEAFEEVNTEVKVSNQALFLRMTKPFYKRYFLPIIQSSKHRESFKGRYKQKLANAGLLKEMTPEEFVALKFFMIIGGPFAFLTVRWIVEENWSLSLTPLMGVVGFYYPDVWLSGRIKRRGDQIIQAMPFIVDMLALSVEAGLDFMAAIQRVIEKAPSSPLVEEFEMLVRETKIGSSRADGLRQLGWRVNIIEVNSFCATLIAADSVGASIGPLLKQLSNEIRMKRSARAEQKGATAATKILIPMIFFILPAVLVAIFAPMVLKMMAGKL